VPLVRDVERPLAGALGPAVQAVAHQGAQSLLAAGLGALLAETTRAAVQQQAEQGLHRLLQTLFETAPAGIANPEMQGKIERTLQLVLHESLEAVFAEGCVLLYSKGASKLFSNRCMATSAAP
jgi:hypothetical protein